MSAPGGVFVSVPFGTAPDWRTGAKPAAYSSSAGDKYLEAIGREIRLRAAGLGDASFDTVYFGGCGPSSLSLDQLYRLLQVLYDTITMVPREQTMVVLPGTVDPARAKVLRESGFDRVELRTTDPTATRTDFDVLRDAEFPTVGVELEAAGDPEAWEATISAFSALDPDHVVLHGQTGLLDRGRARLDSLYREYVPGHFCRHGHECHFLEAASAGAPLLGLGPGALTRLTGRVEWCEPDPGRYNGAMKRNRLPLVSPAVEPVQPYIEPYE